ncbi:hypothetical protein Tco_0639080 [Tanacetum coccineum]
MACTEWSMSWCRLARTLVTSTIDQVAFLEVALHLRIEERSSYMKIKEVRMKSSKCEGGCFMVIEGNAKEYQIRRGTCSRAYEKLRMVIYKSKFLRAESGVNGLERSEIFIDNQRCSVHF